VAEVAWAGVQRVALDGAHPAWFRPLDDALLARARASRTGRRLLARGLLAEGAAPQLFGNLSASLPVALADQRWLFWSTPVLEELALDLGALAFGPAIRRRVERVDVLRLRRVLGARRYADALKPAAGRGEASDAMRDVLGAALADDDLLAAMLRRRGWMEWIAFAGARHPVLVERLRLCAAPRTGADRIESGGAARLLDDAAIATHLAGAGDVRPQTEVADGARGDH
jgi:hypothetical protein